MDDLEKIVEHAKNAENIKGDDIAFVLGNYKVVLKLDVTENDVIVKLIKYDKISTIYGTEVLSEILTRSIIEGIIYTHYKLTTVYSSEVNMYLSSNNIN